MIVRIIWDQIVKNKTRYYNDKKESGNYIDLKRIFP